MAESTPRDYDGDTYVSQKKPARKYFAALPRAEVRVAEADDGQWMWACSFHSSTWGFGYAPLPKWGNFAADRDAALDAGRRELMVQLEGHENVPTPVLAWLRSLLATAAPMQLELFA